jgi:CheY-like chemotaxis protein
MDCLMPIMDGFDAAKKIRSIPSNSSTPIVAVTAATATDIEKEAHEAGMGEILPKPHTECQLETILRKYLTDPLPPA